MSNSLSTAPVRKVFNEQQANASLVFVGAVAEDIVRKWSHVLSMKEEERTRHLSKLSDTKSPASMLDAELLIEEIHYHTREITTMGCFVKDLAKGTILFPTVINGESTYLTWMVGDKSVRRPSAVAA